MRVDLVQGYGFIIRALYLCGLNIIHKTMEQPKNNEVNLLCLMKDVHVAQEQQAVLRSEACQLAEAQHEAVLAVESRCEQLVADKDQLRALLTDMRSAVEALVQDNARLHAAARPGLDLQAEIQRLQ